MRLQAHPARRTVTRQSIHVPVPVYKCQWQRPPGDQVTVLGARCTTFSLFSVSLCLWGVCFECTCSGVSLIYDFWGD
jgi:hypothetical protein